MRYVENELEDEVDDVVEEFEKCELALLELEVTTTWLVNCSFLLDIQTHRVNFQNLDCSH